MSKKKLNNKGFAVSAMLYTLLTAFLLFLGASLAQFSSSAKILSNANKDLTDGFAYNISVYYNVNGNGLKTSPSYKLNGQFLIDGNVYQNFDSQGKTPWTLFATTNFSYVNKYSYPVVGMPYVPLDNDFVVNKAGLTKKGYRFIGWGNPTLRWLYIEKNNDGTEITSGAKADYDKTINYANLLNYASGREGSDYIPLTEKEGVGNVTVNALQIIYEAKWDVDVFVYYLYKNSCTSGESGTDEGNVPYKYTKENYSLYGNITGVNKIDYPSINSSSATGEKKMYYYDYSTGNQDVANAEDIASITESGLENFIERKDKATGIVIVIDKRSTSECP